MNVLAGIFIGWLNTDWLGRALIPFAWAVVRCVQFWIFRGHVAYEERNAGRTPTPLIGTLYRAYYVTEFGTAAATALAFSLVAGAVHDWASR